MSGRVADKVALITGGGSGIGAATAQRLHEEGAKVMVVDINGTNAERVAAELRERGGEASHFVADVTDPDAVQGMIQHAVKTFGRLDILHNNATAAEVGSVANLSLEGWNRTLAVNVTAPFLATKYALPIMIGQGGGAIVNTASISGTRGDYGMAAYNAGLTPVARWNTEIRDQGDPLLWMESVPYWETRGYVNIVMRNYWMYERQAARPSESRMALAQGAWPTFPGLAGSKAVRMAANGAVLRGR